MEKDIAKEILEIERRNQADQEIADKIKDQDPDLMMDEIEK